MSYNVGNVFIKFKLERIKFTVFCFLLICLSSISVQASESFEVHRTKMDSSVKTCPEDLMILAREILKLELAGMRWRRSKSSCFESLELKYVHAIKNPDEHAVGLVKVKEGSLKILSVKENPEFYSQSIFFTVVNEKGETLKEMISFMTNTDLGKAKPANGCALITALPEKALVSESCL